MLTAEAMPRSFAARSLPFATSSAALRSVPGSVARRTSRALAGLFSGAGCSAAVWVRASPRRGLLLPDSFNHLLQTRTAPGRQELCRRCDDPLRRSCLPAGLPEPREMRRHEGDHLELEAVRRSHRLGIALHLEQRSLELFCLPLDPRFLLALARFQPPIAVA